MRRLFKWFIKNRKARSSGQALVEYILLFAILAIFGQWAVKYFTGILSDGASLLSVNLTTILHTGFGW